MWGFNTIIINNIDAKIERFAFASLRRDKDKQVLDAYQVLGILNK